MNHSALVRYNTNMKYEYVLDNFYTEEEKEKIWIELQYLRANEYGWNTPNYQQNAWDRESGQIYLKNALQYGVNYRSQMDIQSTYNSSIYIYGNKIVKWFDVLTNHAQLYHQLAEISDRSTYITYYPGNDSSYYSHRDACTFTMLSYFFKEPKNFTGGEFYVENRIYEIHNGFTVIFPSWMKHGSIKVKLIDETKKDSGRYAVANFFFINPFADKNNYFFSRIKNRDDREIVLFDESVIPSAVERRK